MLATDVTEPLPGGSSLLRNEPVQARSSARLTGLLDAAAAIIDEIGYERLTTAMVAERAGASIGTVYRYFPDRIAVVDALALRSLQRLSQRVTDSVSDDTVTTWQQAVAVVVDSTVEMYRSEPGFRAIRFGDSPDRDEVDAASAVRSPLTEHVLGLLVDRFAVVRTAETELALETVVEIGNALLARAFVTGGDGDQRFIDECRRVVTLTLDSRVTVG
ncbi:TetR/AcrR family transcriptional regulator [Frigoribacterium sp. 2-23]|uniref:TetR/AcrR family transcriptional regulator n=1 Tax=Frigoribacterium sp. 2-23 TaxID=3415006 RepID=UPI003C6EE090